MGHYFFDIKSTSFGCLIIYIFHEREYNAIFISLQNNPLPGTLSNDATVAGARFKFEDNWTHILNPQYYSITPFSLR